MATLENANFQPEPLESHLAETLNTAAYDGATAFLENASAFLKTDSANQHLPNLELIALDPGQCVSGEISHYGDGDDLYGELTASGETLHRGAPTMALPDYNNAVDQPFNVVVENLANGKKRTLRVNDMGPAKKLNRVGDIESANFRLLSPKKDLFQGKICRPK